MALFAVQSGAVRNQKRGMPEMFFQGSFGHHTDFLAGADLRADELGAECPAQDTGNSAVTVQERKGTGGASGSVGHIAQLAFPNRERPSPAQHHGDSIHCGCVGRSDVGIAVRLGSSRDDGVRSVLGGSHPDDAAYSQEIAAYHSGVYGWRSQAADQGK